MDENIKVPNGYHLVWSEEFNSDSIKFSDWNIEARPSGAFNGEFQEYVQSEENIFVKDGMLHIRPVQRFDENGRAYYSSGLITTAGKHEFTYGHFEIRLKVPYGRGLIPFVKLCSDSRKYGTWPIGGQIDIMQLPCHTPQKNYSTVHYGETATSRQGAYHYPVGTDAACDFHTYGVDWVPGNIKFSVDGIDFFEVNREAPFNHPFYFEIGLAIGGSLAGTPDECTRFSENNSLIIDYIRVSQKDSYVETESNENPRKIITVCGGWEDGENFYSFINSLQTLEITKDYLLAAFSFGNPDELDGKTSNEEMKLADYVNRQDSAAIVIFAEMIKNPTIVRRLIDIGKKRGIPVFVFEHEYEDVVNVRLNFKAGFEEICRHIVEHHGVKKVDMFAGNRGNIFSEERIDVFKKVLTDNEIGFDERMIHYADFWESTAEQMLNDLLDSGYEVPEAIICANDSMAIGISNALMKRGFKIPEDVLVSGFDGIRAGQINIPSLTSAAPDYSEFVSIIGEVVNNWNDDAYKSRVISEGFEVDYQMIINSSCGCNDNCDDNFKRLIAQATRDNTDCYKHLLEMGKFVSNSIKKDNLIDAMSNLKNYLGLWKDQFYFVGFEGSDNKLRALFCARNNIYKKDQRYMHLDGWLPEMDSHREANSGENIILFKQVRIQSNDFAFVSSGYNRLKFRDLRRFEELSLFVAAVANAVFNNQKYISANNEIERISEMDYLTGLYNRRGFFREIENRIARIKVYGAKLKIALFSIDMDGLKQINDLYGHMEGDEAISIFANILLRYAGGNGICARYGGDEFAFAYVGEKIDTVDIEFVRNSIETLINSDFAASRKPYKISASIGYAEGNIDDKFDMEKLIKEADMSMYLEKQNRKKND